MEFLPENGPISSSAQVYGRVSTQTGHMKKNTGSGIWAYKLKEKVLLSDGTSPNCAVVHYHIPDRLQVAQYLGTSEAFMVSEPNEDDDDEWYLGRWLDPACLSKYQWEGRVKGAGKFANCTVAD